MFGFFKKKKSKLSESRVASKESSYGIKLNRTELEPLSFHMPSINMFIVKCLLTNQLATIRVGKNVEPWLGFITTKMINANASVLVDAKYIDDDFIFILNQIAKEYDMVDVYVRDLEEQSTDSLVLHKLGSKNAMYINAAGVNDEDCIKSYRAELQNILALRDADSKPLFLIVDSYSHIGLDLILELIERRKNLNLQILFYVPDEHLQNLELHFPDPNHQAIMKDLFDLNSKAEG